MLTGGTALGQAVALLAAPVLTRLYTPEDFGYLALYASVLSVLVVVASLRYHLAIPLPESDEDATSLLALSACALVLTVCASALALAWLGPHLLELLDSRPFEPYLWLIPLGLLGAGAYQILSYWAIRVNAHGPLGATKFAQGVGLATTQVGLGFLVSGPLGLMVGDIVGRAAGSGNLLRLIRKHIGGKRPTRERLARNAARYRRFPLFSSGSALLNSAGLQLPSLVLLSLYGPQVAGWFALSQRVIAVPMTLLGTSVSQVYTGRAAELARTAPEELRMLFDRTAARMFLLALVPTAVLALIAPWLFGVVFGSDWTQAGRYTQILAPMFLVQFAVVPLSQTLNILERQEVQLAWDAGRLVMVLSAFGLAMILGWPALYALIAFAVAMSLAYALLFGLNALALRRQGVPHEA